MTMVGPTWVWQVLWSMLASAGAAGGRCALLSASQAC